MESKYKKRANRIKHMEKCLYGINQASLIEVIFGLSWLLLCLWLAAAYILSFTNGEERGKKYD